MIDGLVKLMNCEGFMGPVNVGNPGEFSIAQLAELVLKIVGSKSEIDYRPLPQDDPIQRCPDISLAKEKLDWEPLVPLEQGLEQTIEYFKEVL
jgi:UDP-glucuronate decarboxylase